MEKDRSSDDSWNRKRGRPPLSSTRETFAKLDLWDALPSYEILYISSSFTFFLGSAIFGAKQFLRYEDKTSDLRQMMKTTKVPTQLAFKALLYGTALSVGTFGLGIMLYCSAFNIQNTQDFGRHMKSLFKLYIGDPHHPYEVNQRKIEKEEREEREFWESLYGIVGKEANVNKVHTKTSQNDEGTKYSRK